MHFSQALYGCKEITGFVQNILTTILFFNYFYAKSTESNILHWQNIIFCLFM